MKALIFALVIITGLSAIARASQDDTIYRAGYGVSVPQPVHEAKPQYTADAMRRRVQGAVLLECIVNREGVPTNVEVVRSLDEDLDEESVKVLSQWRFQPGMKDGRAVLVRIQVAMTFTVGQPRRSEISILTAPFRWLLRQLF